MASRHGVSLRSLALSLHGTHRFAPRPSGGRFNIALLEAAAKLQLTLVPDTLMVPFPEAAAPTSSDAMTTGPSEEVAAALAELMPSPELTEKAGFA